MKSTLKIGAFLLALFLLIPGVAGCGSPSISAEDTTAVMDPVIETEPVTEAETEYLDVLETKDMDGYAYRIVAQHTEDRPNFPLSDEMTGEVVNDAVHSRDEALKARLNITLSPISYTDRGVLKSEVARTILAQDDAYDLIMTAFSDGINTLVTQNLLEDLTTIPYITLDSVYWNKSIAENMRFNGKQFFTSGASSVSYLYSSTHMLVNRTMAEGLQLPDMQALAFEGKWTVDTLASMMTNAASDLNGDGKMVMEDDRYAAILGHTLGNEMYMAAGLHAVSCDENGNWILNIGDEDSMNFIQKCASLFSDTSRMLNFASTSEPHYRVFTEGRSLFIDSTVRNTIYFVRGMEEDYGVLPIPVLNEGDPYLTECNTWLPSGIAVPVTATNPERLGLIMETMAVYSYEHLVPAVAEKALGKVSNTSSDYQILTMTFDNCSFELNTIMDFAGTSVSLRGACFGTPSNFASYWAKVKTKAQQALDDFISSVHQ